MAYDDDMDETENQPLDPNIRKQLREAEKIRKEAEALRAELENQKREIEFTKAGVPDSTMANYFKKGYDGPADAESIRQAAIEAGLIQQAQAPQEPSYEAELEAQRRAQGATIGTTGATPDKDQEYFAALAAATSPEEVMKVVNGSLGQSVGAWSSSQSR